MYTVIDIETTGGSPFRDKITEIAILVFDGVQIIDKFVSLINPERTIPYYITQMTGINNEMVADAPKFYEIAKKIVEITENRTFVAHNVNFDYNFIRNEFKQLGYEFRRKKLCTIRLSRKLIPGKKSYSLGKLCDSLNIKINNRHRAEGDAQATTRLFELLLSIDSENKPLGFQFTADKFSGLHPNLKQSLIDKLPENAGVYYFYDEKQKLIYIGKSKNIRQRVETHLLNQSTKRAIEMKQRIADIGYTETGSELVALLMESDEIKAHKPLYNRSQRRTASHYGLFSYQNEDGYICFEVKRNNKTEDMPLISFRNAKAAQQFMERTVSQYQLCQKLCHLYKTDGACFYYSIKECNGACIGEEPVDRYNLRAEKVIENISYSSKSFIVIDKGRHENEKSVVKVVNGKYIGFGYIDVDCLDNDIDLISDCVKPYQDNRDIQQILRNYLQNNYVEHLITL